MQGAAFPESVLVALGTRRAHGEGRVHRPGQLGTDAWGLRYPGP